MDNSNDTSGLSHEELKGAAATLFSAGGATASCCLYSIMDVLSGAENADVECGDCIRIGDGPSSRLPSET